MNEESAIASGVRRREPLVLVADDFPDAQTIYGLTFRREGYRVAFASSGDEAISLARDLHPDAVVMDLCLRGRDGYSAMCELRADPKLEAIPVVAVSGYGDLAHETAAYECGCDMFVCKSCPMETLLSIVHGLIARSSVMKVAVAVASERPSD